MADSGIRIVDFPPLGDVTDASRIVGTAGGTGTYTAAQVKGYILGNVGGIDDRLVSLETRATGLEDGVAANSSAILSLQATAASASALTSLQTTVGGLSSAVSSLQSTTSSQATSLLSLGTRTTDAESKISTLQTTTASQASSLTTLSSTVSSYSATLTSLAAVNVALGASYELKTDVNGVVAGFGLSNSGSTTGNNITFTTDNFRIKPTGGTAAPIFETIGGVTYIKSAAIGTAAIDQFKLQDGSVITAKMALNAASEPFSFYSAFVAQHPDTLEHNYLFGTITVPTGGSAYCYIRAQGYSYDGSGWDWKFYDNSVLVDQLPDPPGGFVTGTNYLQERNFPLILGAGTHNFTFNWRARGMTSAWPATVLAHIVGFVQKK